jgi:hypothetical protein
MAADSRRPTKSDAKVVATYKRAKYAAGALGLTVGEIGELMHSLEYHDSLGIRYPWLSDCIARLEQKKGGA